MRIPLHSCRGGVLEVRYGPGGILPPLAMPRELRSQFRRPWAIGCLQARGQLAVETHPLRRAEPLIYHLVIEIMRKAIARGDRPIGPHIGPTRLDKVAPPCWGVRYN